jgi:hypothetical protein
VVNVGGRLQSTSTVIFRQPIPGYKGQLPLSYSAEEEKVYEAKLNHIVKTQVRCFPPWCFFHSVGKLSKLCEIRRFPESKKDYFTIAVEGESEVRKVKTVRAAMKTSRVLERSRIPWNFDCELYFTDIYRMMQTAGQLETIDIATPDKSPACGTNPKPQPGCSTWVEPSPTRGQKRSESLHSTGANCIVSPLRSACVTATHRSSTRGREHSEGQLDKGDESPPSPGDRLTPDLSRGTPIKPRSSTRGLGHSEGQLDKGDESLPSLGDRLAPDLSSRHSYKA